MSTFKYRVLTKGSAVLEGKRASVSKGELIDYLKKSGHIVLKVEEVGGAKTSSIFSDRSVKKATVFLHRNSEYYSKAASRWTKASGYFPMHRRIRSLME